MAEVYRGAGGGGGGGGICPYKNCLERAGVHTEFFAGGGGHIASFSCHIGIALPVMPCTLCICSY